MSQFGFSETDALLGPTLYFYKCSHGRLWTLCPTFGYWYGSTSTQFFLDWLFVDWEFGYNIREWDQKLTRNMIVQRMKAVQAINTSKSTVGYHWVGPRAASETIDTVLETGSKKFHDWTTVSTHKQAKKGGNVPFQYSTQRVYLSD